MAWWLWLHQRTQGDCAVLWRSDFDGCCDRPAGTTKSNSIRARCEGRQVVRPCQSARACGKHSTWESVTYGTPLARGPATTLSLSQQGLSGWQSTEPRDKNHRVNIVHPVGLLTPNTSLYLLFHMLCLCCCSCVANLLV